MIPLRSLFSICSALALLSAISPAEEQPLFAARPLTTAGAFTTGIEGPA